MKLLIVFPLTGITNEGIASREKRIRETVGLDVEFDLQVIEKGPASIESKTEELLASFHVLKLLEDVDSIEKEYDGILIWCAGDPAVEALREQFTIPVVGPGQAMISLANIVSNRYGMVTPSSGDAEMIMNLFYHSGLENRLVVKKPLDMSVLDLKNDPSHLKKQIVKAGEEMIKEYQIQSLLLGCMGFFGLGKELEKELKIPVIDPGISGLHLLKMMVDSNMEFSRKKYPALRKEIVINE